jgi:hypothetical protein
MDEIALDMAIEVMDSNSFFQTQFNNRSTYDRHHDHLLAVLERPTRENTFFIFYVARMPHPGDGTY